MNKNFRDIWPDYDPGRYFCELTRHRPDAGPVPEWLIQRLGQIGLDALRARASAAETELIDLGVTFTVYSDATAIDRILPFDCIPRILTCREWALLESACIQRVAALNAFLGDIYGPGHIVKDGVQSADFIIARQRRTQAQAFFHKVGVLD